MKYIDFYREKLNCHSEEEVFQYITNHLKPSIFIWSYFVNWTKVFKNINQIEMGLNLLNYLIGKKDFDREFRALISEHPELFRLVPALIVRGGDHAVDFNILVDYQQKKLVYEEFCFDTDHPSERQIDQALLFIEKTGLKELLVSQRIKNLVDYMIGVETGLDCNGRKNRIGQNMETLMDFFIQDLCHTKGYQYLHQANSNSIRTEWNMEVPQATSSRRYDFVVNTRKELVIIETNFYSGGGSKLKSTAGEYRDLQNFLKGKHKFIWITDGIGWKSTLKPLRETFDSIEHLITLDMIEQGILEAVI